VRIATIRLRSNLDFDAHSQPRAPPSLFPYATCAQGPPFFQISVFQIKGPFLRVPLSHVLPSFLGPTHDFNASRPSLRYDSLQPQMSKETLDIITTTHHSHFTKGKHLLKGTAFEGNVPRNRSARLVLKNAPLLSSMRASTTTICFLELDVAHGCGNK